MKFRGPVVLAAYAAFKILAVLILVVSGCNRVQREDFALEIERLTSSTPSWVPRTELGHKLWSSEQRFYRERGHLPAWIDGDRPTPQLDALVGALGEADTHGRDPRSYGLEALRTARAQAARGRLRHDAIDHERVPDLDLRATYSFLTYTADLLGWSSSPPEIDGHWIADRLKADLVVALNAALDHNHVAQVLDELAPQSAQYKGLQAAMKQARDGGAGGASEWDLQRIRMNLQRWRWLPRDLGDRYLMVNVPAYELRAVEKDQPVLSMRVIVGKPDWPTPFFSDEMTYVVFSPSWNIPENILREETLPRVARDPDYLTRSHIEVVGTSGRDVDLEDIDWSDPEQTRGLRLRQTPGPDNALGTVKFVFPNHFDVYLHDTPNDNLFNTPKRTLSHGCIRVEDPAALASYVLRGRPEWSRDRIVHAMQGGNEQAVTLEAHLPVHIVYLTAWVQPDGTVKFFDDPYGIDKKQARM